MGNINVSIDTEKVSQSTNVEILCKKAEVSINNQSDYDLAAIVLKDVKSRYKHLDEQRKNITKPIDDAKKLVMDLFRQPLELLNKAESYIKDKMMDYTSEIQRKAEEERQRLQKLADDEAEKQRKIIETKIERAKASGKEEKAKELETQKENINPIIAPLVTPAINQPKGISYKDNWSVEIVNVASIPREYLMPNMILLNSFAKQHKGTQAIPGVRFVCEQIISARS